MSRAVRRLHTPSAPRRTRQFDVDVVKTSHGTRKLKSLAPPTTTLRQLAKSNKDIAVQLSQLESDRGSLLDRISGLQDHLIADQDLIAGLRTRVSQLSQRLELATFATSKSIGKRRTNYQITSENLNEVMAENPVLVNAFITGEFDIVTDVLATVDPACFLEFLGCCARQLNRIAYCFDMFKKASEWVQDIGFVDDVKIQAKKIWDAREATLFIRDFKDPETTFRFVIDDREAILDLSSEKGILLEALEKQDVLLENGANVGLGSILTAHDDPTLVIPVGSNGLFKLRGTYNGVGFTVEDQMVGTFFSKLYYPLLEGHISYLYLLKTVARRRALYSFASALNVKRTFKELLPFLLSVLSDLCGANDVELFMVGNRSFYSFEVVDGKLAQKTFPFVGAPKAIYQSGTCFVTENLNSETCSMFDPVIDSWTENKSFMGIPVEIENNIMAILCVSDKLTANRFDSWDMSFLESVARSVSLILPKCLLDVGKLALDPEVLVYMQAPQTASEMSPEQLVKADTIKNLALKMNEMMGAELLTIYMMLGKNEVAKRLITLRKGSPVDETGVNDGFVYWCFDQQSPLVFEDITKVPHYRVSKLMPMQTAVVAHNKQIAIMCFNCGCSHYRGLALSVFADLVQMILKAEQLNKQIAESKSSNITLRNVLDITSTAVRNKEEPLKHLMTMICDLINMSGVALLEYDSGSKCHRVFIGSPNAKKSSMPIDDPIVKSFKFEEKAQLIDKLGSSTYNTSRVLSLFADYIEKVVFLNITESVYAVFMGDKVTLNFQQVLALFKPIIITFLTNYQLKHKEPPPSEVINVLRTRLQDSDVASRLFNVLRLTSSEKVEAVVKMFQNLDLLRVLRTQPSEFTNTIVKIRDGYKDIPFHNWDHAVDTAQFVYSSLVRGKLRRYFTLSQLAAILLAALCHDLGHEGLTTTYHNKVRSHLTYSFGEQSTMERYSAQMACDILESSSIRDAIDTPVFWRFFVSCIVATDMVRHFEFIEQFKSVTAKFDMGSELHRLSLAQFLVKCANFANTTRPFECAKHFGLGLELEYKNQSEKERQVNVEITKFGDEDGMPIWDIEMSFYSGIVDPTLDELAKFCPDLKDFQVQMADNMKQWNDYGLSQRRASEGHTHIEETA